MSDRTESYRDPCPKCGSRLLGFSKVEYVQHLRENGETLAARIEEELVVPESATRQTTTSDESASKQGGNE